MCVGISGTYTNRSNREYEVLTIQLEGGHMKVRYPTKKCFEINQR
jgi:hypothetical protein